MERVNSRARDLLQGIAAVWPKRIGIKEKMKGSQGRKVKKYHPYLEVSAGTGSISKRERVGGKPDLLQGGGA